MLFDENAESIGARTKQHAESTFDYYNRSSRKDIKPIKDVLEQWFTHIPDAARNDLRQRFRSRNDPQHRAALFELFIHELFTRIGYSLELHPVTEGSTRPD